MPRRPAKILMTLATLTPWALCLAKLWCSFWPDGIEHGAPDAISQLASAPALPPRFAPASRCNRCQSFFQTIAPTPRWSQLRVESGLRLSSIAIAPSTAFLDYFPLGDTLAWTVYVGVGVRYDTYGGLPSALLHMPLDIFIPIGPSYVALHIGMRYAINDRWSLRASAGLGDLDNRSNATLAPPARWVLHARFADHLEDQRLTYGVALRHRF